MPTLKQTMTDGAMATANACPHTRTRIISSSKEYNPDYTVSRVKMIEKCRSCGETWTLYKKYDGIFG